MENKVINKIQEKLKNNCMEYKSFPIKARELEKYNSLYPKAAKIILQDFERMSINKVEYQKRSLEAKIKMDKLAQWQGFIFCLLMIISAVISQIAFLAIGFPIFLSMISFISSLIQAYIFSVLALVFIISAEN